jgi:hypothetical protein
LRVSEHIHVDDTGARHRGKTAPRYGKWTGEGLSR